MNERRKSEGEQVDNMLYDERSRAQKLLDKCKEAERTKNLKGVPFGKNTLYAVPVGTDIEYWKEKKRKQYEKHWND
jgi:hypothetical protein